MHKISSIRGCEASATLQQHRNYSENGRSRKQRATPRSLVEFLVTTCSATMGDRRGVANAHGGTEQHLAALEQLSATAFAVVEQPIAGSC